MQRINKIKLFINNDDKSITVAAKLKQELLDNSFIIDDNNFDLGISIGGDGSFLKMVHENNFNKNIYYIGINSGTLGFLQEIDIDNTSNFVERLRHNDYKIEELATLKSIVYMKDKIYEVNSLNEVVVRREDFKILKTPVYIDQELLEHFTGDGILISTSTGSTAYNMSFKGSIIYNTLNAYILTPIAPINNRAYNTLTNSIVIPNDKKITLEGNVNDLFLMVDGKSYNFKDVEKIEYVIINNSIKCLRMNDFHFIKVINKKIVCK